MFVIVPGVMASAVFYLHVGSDRLWGMREELVVDLKDSGRWKELVALCCLLTAITCGGLSILSAEIRQHTHFVNVSMKWVQGKRLIGPVVTDVGVTDPSCIDGRLVGLVRVETELGMGLMVAARSAVPCYYIMPANTTHESCDCTSIDTNNASIHENFPSTFPHSLPSSPSSKFGYLDKFNLDYIPEEDLIDQNGIWQSPLGLLSEVKRIAVEQNLGSKAVVKKMPVFVYDWPKSIFLAQIEEIETTRQFLLIPIGVMFVCAFFASFAPVFSKPGPPYTPPPHVAQQLEARRKKKEKGSAGEGDGEGEGAEGEGGDGESGGGEGGEGRSENERSGKAPLVHV